MARTLNYWVAESLTDSKAYNIRSRKKGEIIDKLKSMGLKLRRAGGELVWSDENKQPQYRHLHRVVVQFENPFDLLRRCLGEGSIDESSANVPPPETPAEAQPSETAPVDAQPA